MICLALQDYINIRADSGLTAVTQNESGWVDLIGFQDVVAFLEVKEFSGATITISYQTSPSKDESLFVNMTSAVTLAAGTTITKMLKDSATVPLARYVRWLLSASSITGNWDAYFRVWLACNRAGKRGQIPLAADTLHRMLPSAPSVPIGRGGRPAGAPTSFNLPSAIAAPGVGMLPTAPPARPGGSSPTNPFGLP